MKTKFKIFYPQDRPPSNSMVVMNSEGIFFLFNDEQYYPSIRHLSEVLPKYDVVFQS